MDKRIIALVGPMGVGKEEVVIILKTFGYQRFSLSDIVREEAEMQRLDKSRKNLQDVADALRKNFGLSILAKRTEDRIKQANAGLVVIDGSRHPSELTYFKEKLGAYILGINTPETIRIRRLVDRGREGDPKTISQLKASFTREMGDRRNKHGQQMGLALGTADTVIDNDGTLEELRAKIISLLI